MRQLIATLTFVCVSVLSLRAQVVISEIMYNPPGPDTLLEYLEIYNAGNAAVDISNWTFTGITYTFPVNTSMAAGAYIVIAANASDANLLALGVNSLKWINSALTNTGEKLELKDAAGNIVDEVDYKAAAPWPAAANNTGASMVLCDPKSDNSLPANWAAATTPTTLTVGGRPLFANPGKASNCGFTFSYPVRTIAQMTTENTSGVADSLGKPCELNGTVYGVNLQASGAGTQFVLIDNTVNNGIVVFNGGKKFGYTVTEKDRVTVRGTINQFNGLTQINADTIIKVSSDNPLVAPRLVTALSESTESSLIQIKNLSLYDPTQWTTGMGTGFTVSAFSPNRPNDTIRIRIDNDVDLFNLPAPPQPFDLTGLGGQFDNSNPYTDGYQVLPRYRNDISTLVRTREANFSHAVTITPNPASEYCSIRSSIVFDRLRIYAPAGQMLYSVENAFSAQQIDLRDWKPGVYFLQFEKDGGVWTTRMVKM